MTAALLVLVAVLLVLLVVRSVTIARLEGVVLEQRQALAGMRTRLAAAEEDVWGPDSEERLGRGLVVPRSEP